MTESFNFCPFSLLGELRDDRAGGGIDDGLGDGDYGDGGGYDPASGLSIGSPNGRGLDERTEIILAATFLVLIILAFIRSVLKVLPF